MTQEEKAKAYDEAIKVAQRFYNNSVAVTKKGLEDIFPELKESEDDRIRKELIDYFNSSHTTDTFRGIPWDRVVAWLEKQGEHANFLDKIQIGDKVTRNEDGMLVNLSQLNRVAKVDEKKNEQEYVIAPKFSIGDTIRNKTTNEVFTITNRCISLEYYCDINHSHEVKFSEQDNWELVVQKPADKVEPWFKAGNWYLCIKDFYGKGVRFDKGSVYYCKLDGCLQQFDSGAHISIVEELYEYFRLWTIQDAKDGDVLSYRDGQWIFIYKGIVTEGTFKYYALLSEKGITVNDAAFSLLSSCITPATKEQRDTLMKAMADAGYTFNFDKKELKKIEQKQEWSEEDEKERKRIIGLLEGWLSTFKETCYAEDCKCGINWLKSIRDRARKFQMIYSDAV